MKENETRSLKMFIPDLNKVSNLKLQSGTIEPVLMGDVPSGLCSAST